MKKKLMILGSLHEFTKLTAMAKERGYETYVCDGYPDGPAKAIADHAHNVDVREITSLATYAKKNGIDGIITSFSDLLFECMVKIADRADLDCYIKPNQLPWYRDKDQMKQLFEKLGIPTAHYVCLKQDYSDSELSDLHFPVVTKPIDMYGSRGLYVLNSVSEVRSYFAKACSSSSQKEIIVEEYNTGYEFNLMSWVFEGKVYILGIADREKSPIGSHEIPISSRNIYPSRLIHQVYEPAKAILETFIAATGQTEGALSMQFFWTPQKGIEVCEIAGRLLGYEHELIEYSSGLSIEKLLLDSVFDRPALKVTLQNHSPFSENNSAVLYFQGHAGIIGSMKSAREISDWPEIISSQIFYHDGEAIGNHGPQPYVARYCISSQRRAHLDNITKKIFDRMTVKDFHGQELLYPNQMTDYPDDLT